MFQAKDFRAGEPLSARVMNAILDEVERLSKFSVASPLTMADDVTGIHVGVDLRYRTWILLTSAGTDGRYAWTEQIAVPGGTWEDHPGGRTGTTSDDPAVESTGKADVTTGAGQVHAAWRDPVSLALIFTAGAC